MTLGGWIMLITSVSAVTTLFIWCIYMVITLPEETEHLHGFRENEPDNID